MNATDKLLEVPRTQGLVRRAPKGVLSLLPALRFHEASPLSDAALNV